MNPEPTEPAPRDATADLLKGTAVVLMIQVHLMELFALPAVFDGWAGKLSLFLGGPPAAAVFMAVMGYYVAASPRSAGSLVWRGLKLIGLGVLLNLGLNAHLLWKIHSGVIALNHWSYVLGVDILFLAGASTILLAALRRSVVLPAAAAVIIVLLAPWATTALTTASPARWAFAFVGGAYEWSYFPWFPWLAYPLLGFAWRQLQPRIPAGAQRWTAVACAAVAAATGSYAVAVSHDLPRYYHHDPRFFLWTCAFLAAWASLHQACAARCGNAAPVRWLTGIGRNVTACYVLQWLLIGNIATSLFRSESLLHWGLWVIAIVTATSLFSMALTRRAAAARQGDVP